MDHHRLRRLGIVPVYEGTDGERHTVDPDTVRHLLRAMDLPEDADRAPRGDEVVVTRPGTVRAAPAGELELEGGGVHPVDGRLPAELPLGYHTLHRSDGATTTVVVGPGRPPAHPGRIWGWAVQLYSLLSEDSWGVGDLADLRELGRWSTREGAGVALVNPLDAVIPEHPRRTSPYFPSSRRFRDPLYLRVEEVPGAAAVADELPALAAGTRRDDDRIDRDRIAAAKQAALERIWESAPDAGREPGFVRYRREQGEPLEAFATFMVLAERHGGGWQHWPAELAHPTSAAVRAAAAADADRVRFHAWVQWLIDEQLRAAGAELPLMRDLPIGFDPSGADAWEWQDLLAHDVTIGAPPDDLGPAGQDWRMPAFVPWKLRAARYQPFIATIRSALRHAAAVRIDHVLGLFRLFWIPPGGPTHGAYVRQDTRELLDILALEAHRAGAYVVGEDLGTVGPGVRERLQARRLLRYRVLWFEHAPAADWDADALGSITTHDLPTIAGLWTLADIAEHRSLGLPIDEARLEALRRRLADRAGLSPDASPADACVAAARLLAGAGCDVVVSQVEDAVAATHRINLPGTDEDRPDNWSRTLPVRREQLSTDPTVRRVVDALRSRRGRAPARSPG